MPASRRLPAILLGIGLLAGACGGDEPTEPARPSPARSPNPAVGPPDIDVPIESATVARDELLRIAEAEAQPDPGEEVTPNFGVVAAWQEAVPGLEATGYAVPPDPSTVSVYANVQNAKDVAGEENPYVVSFAVEDTDGNCAGGVMAGFPSLEEFLPVNAPSECDPLTIAAEGGFETFG